LRRAIALARAALSASLVGACSPATLLGAIQPSAAGGEVRGVPYADGPRHTMDIYVPAEGRERPPVVVFFYGGGWTSGTRTSYRFLGRSLASCGVMTVIPDYRVWPETGFPGFLRDAAASVAAARTEAERRGGDVSRLYLMGHSAGAYIAMMLALDPTWLTGTGIDSRQAFAGVVGLSGPYDFLPLRDPVLQAIFADAGPRTQPITFAANARQPMLLATGDKDTTVLPQNSIRLAERVRNAGVRVETKIYPGIAHVATIAAFAQPLRFLAPVRTDVCAFLGLRQTVTAPRASQIERGAMAR
jgi:acetyl esterase/lipase